MEIEEVVAKELDDLTDEEKSFVVEHKEELSDEGKEKFTALFGEPDAGDKAGELSDAERKELEELRKKDFNFKKLREQGKHTKEEIAHEKENLAKEWGEFRDNLISERKSDALDMLVGTDEELRKKVLANYDRIVGDASTKQEIYRKMRDAVNLTGGAVAPSPLARQYSSGADRFGMADKRESADSMDIRKHLKIDDEAKKKYSGDWKPKI
jgi:hypothetical protein